MSVKVIASQRWDVFETWCIWDKFSEHEIRFIFSLIRLFTVALLVTHKIVYAPVAIIIKQCNIKCQLSSGHASHLQ